MTEMIEVLLVEDDEDHAELVRRNLMSQAARCRITHVNNGESALDYLHQRAEKTAQVDLGCDFLQGFLLGKPVMPGRRLA